MELELNSWGLINKITQSFAIVQREGEPPRLLLIAMLAVNSLVEDTSAACQASSAPTPSGAYTKAGTGPACELAVS